MSFPRYVWQPTSEEIARAAGLDPAEVERFDHNTSPVPTEWAAEVVLQRSSRLNEYPAASYVSLREAVAANTGLDPDAVIPGAGADELILLAARAFLAPGQSAVMADPTYPMYRIATAQVRGSAVSIEARPPDFGFPVDEIIGAARDAEIVWLCVPSNPIGNRPTDEEIAAVIAATDGVVVLDAAYAEFSGDDWAPWVDRYHNLLVLHTMSKAYGLAAARVGYGLGHPISSPPRRGAPSRQHFVPVGRSGGGGPRSPDRCRSDCRVGHRRASPAGRRPCRTSDAGPAFNNQLPAVLRWGPRARTVADGLMSEGLVTRTFPADGPLASYLRFTVRTTRAHDRLLSALQRRLP